MHGRELRKLGGEIAEALEATRDEHVITRARARLVESGGRDAPSRRAFGLGVVALAGAAAAAFFLMRAGPRGSSAIDEPHAAAVGAEIVAPASRPIPLVEMEGTRLALEPGGRARLVALPSARDAASEGRLELEAGRVSASIARAADAPAWRVAAGPFEIRAHAADVSVAWDASAGVLSVRVEAGSAVTVSRDGRSRAVEPGQEQRFDRSALAP